MIKKGSTLKTSLISILIIFSFISIIFIYSASFTISIYKDAGQAVESGVLQYSFFLFIIIGLTLFATVFFVFGNLVLTDEKTTLGIKTNMKKNIFIGLFAIFIIILLYLLKRYPADPTMRYMIKQMVYYLISFVSMVIFSNINYKTYKDHRWLPFVVGIIALLLVLVIGKETKGATRWIVIGGMTIQPAEFAKICFVLYFAGQLARYEESHKKNWDIFIPGMIVSVTYVFLILAERDLSSSVHLFIVAMFMLFVSNIKKSYSFFMFLAIMSMGVVFIRSSANRWGRVKSFLEGIKHNGVGGGYQATQSVIGIGNGGAVGLGFGNGIQKYYYLPERHTDFIFSIIAEELGFLGSLFVIMLYVLMAFIGFKIIKNSQDIYGKYLAFGIISLVMVQAIINLFVATGLSPTTGITLPFISYGGSSLLALMTAFGILINIIKEGEN
jgi:cell division protein FtsW